MPRAPKTPDTDDTANLPKPPEVIEIDFRGQTFTIPKQRDDWPTVAIVAAREGDLLTIIRSALGESQCRTLDAVAPTLGEFMNEFAPVFIKASQQVIG